MDPVKKHRFGFGILSVAASFAWLAWQYRQQLDRVNGKISLQGTFLDMLANRHTAWEMGWFAAVTVGLYAGFGLINLFAFRRVVAHRVPSWHRRILYFLVQLMLVCLAVELVAAWQFPLSIASNHVGVFIGNPTSQIAATVLVIAVIGYFVVAVWPGKKLLPASTIALLLAGVLTLGMKEARPEGPQSRAFIRSKPDIIVVGIDSLRPDHLSWFGAPMEVMPTLDSWLHESTVFSDTLTPLPNTFPATVSVLTGRYPTAHGARNNLFPQDRVSHEDSIAHRFRSAGYTTVMAMDETRFANVDESYCFDHLVGPQMGSADFLMSIAGDNALSLLASRTSAGKWMLPLFDGNRGFAQAYHPGDVTQKINSVINQVPADKPLFLYVHLCAAHWPYFRPSPQFGYATKPQHPAFPYADTNWMYIEALKAADQQFARLQSHLERTGRLQNALVVVFSDHGEELGMEKDRLKNESGQPISDGFLGHGKSAIQPTQVNVLLAIRGYGRNTTAKGASERPVSLVDIAPTLAQAAGLLPEPQMDGISLLSTGKNSAAVNSDRIRFIESAWMPNAMKRGKIDEVKVAEEAAGIMEVLPSGRLQVKRDFIAFQIEGRQRAVYKSNWALLAPESATQPLVLFERSSRRVLPLSETPASVDVSGMRRALCQHWQIDVIFQRERCGYARSAEVGANTITHEASSQ